VPQKFCRAVGCASFGSPHYDTVGGGHFCARCYDADATHRRGECPLLDEIGNTFPPPSPAPVPAPIPSAVNTDDTTNENQGGPASLAPIAPVFGANSLNEWTPLLQIQDTSLGSVARVRMSGCIATLVLQKTCETMHFSSMFIGVDLRTRLVTGCYIMDEVLEDAIFSGSCVVGWKDDRICVFDAANPSCLVPTHQYRFDDGLFVINAEWLECDANLGPNLQIWLSRDGSTVAKACLWCLTGGMRDVWIAMNGIHIKKKNFNLSFSTNLKWMAWRGKDANSGTMMFVKFLEDASLSRKTLTVAALDFVSTKLTQEYTDTCVELYGLDRSGQLHHKKYAFENRTYTETMSRTVANTQLPSGVDPMFIHVQLSEGVLLGVWIFTPAAVYTYKESGTTVHTHHVSQDSMWCASNEGCFTATSSGAIWGHIFGTSQQAKADVHIMETSSSSSCTRSFQHFETFSASRAIVEALSFNQELLRTKIGDGGYSFSTVKVLYWRRDRTGSEVIDLPFLKDTNDQAVQANYFVQSLPASTSSSLDGTAITLQDRVPAELALVMTEATKIAVHKVLLANRFGKAVALEGEAAGGKSAVVMYCAALSNAPLIRFNLTPSTTVSDFLGDLQLDMVKKDGFMYQLGPFSTAVRDGYWLLLDEANLASDGVLHVIEEVLESGFLRLSGSAIAGQPGVVDTQFTIPMHPNFRLFIAQNPANDVRYGTSRNVFSVSLLSHFVPVRYPSMSHLDLHTIVETKLQRSQFPQSTAAAHELMAIFKIVNCRVESERKLKHYATLRDLLQATDLILAGFKNPSLNVAGGLQLIFAQKLLPEMVEIVRNPCANRCFTNDKDRDPPDLDGNTIQEEELAFLPELAPLFDCLDIGFETGRPVMLCGEDLSGKASAARKW
jgi:hypothetical protein